MTKIITRYFVGVQRLYASLKISSLMAEFWDETFHHWEDITVDLILFKIMVTVMACQCLRSSRVSPGLGAVKRRRVMK